MANTYAEFLRNKKSKEIVQLKKENEPDMQEQSPYTDLTEPKKGEGLKRNQGSDRRIVREDREWEKDAKGNADLKTFITETGSLEIEKNDNKILLTAATVAQHCESGAEVYLVTNDANLQIKADGLNSILPEDLRFDTQFYRRDRLQDKDFAYKGRRMINVRESLEEGYLASGADPVVFGINQSDPDTALMPNEYVEVRHPSGRAELGRYYDGLIYPVFPRTVFGVTPRNSGQIFALDALMAPVEEIPLVILRGQAGTAKTFLTFAAGLEQAYERQLYKNILYTRANVEFDRDIGALPGDEQEKMGSLVRPCMDNIEALFEKHEKGSLKDGKTLSSIAEELIDRGYLRFESMKCPLCLQDAGILRDLEDNACRAKGTT
ncbi:MAG TPA: PhoH family protein [Candidatus Blautia faecipullorum]|nr:PhoH family protein [Candidatus Blautia faecipullorum]